MLEGSNRCGSAGLRKAPEHTVLVGDPKNTSTAQLVNAACDVTTIQVQDGRLDAAGRSIRSIVSYPQVEELDLSHNQIDAFNFSADTTLSHLSLARNELTSLRSLSFPMQLRYLDLSRNPLTSTRSIVLPGGLLGLNLSACSITEICGMRLPDQLVTLDVSHNSALRLIEVRESDLHILKRLKTPLPLISEVDCHHANATVVKLFESTVVCVISDEAFEEMYPQQAMITPPSSHFAVDTTSSNNHTLLVIVLVVGSMLLVLVLVICFRVMCQRQDKASQLDRQSRLREVFEESKGVALLSSSTGERPIGFPMEYFDDDDVRQDEGLGRYRISKDEIVKTKQIGRGGFGVVYLAKYRGMSVAVKQLQRDRMRYSTLRSFMKEIRLYESLHHPHIVSFLGLSWSTVHDLAIVIEYMPRGDLYTLLRKNRKTPTKRKQTKDHKNFDWYCTSKNAPSKMPIARDVAEAVAYLHNQVPPIIHRDLKSKNVLLTESYTAKIADFGISRVQTLEETMTREVGTVSWIAPEVLKGARYNEKADIYSLGVLMTELDTCYSPYTIGLPRNAPKKTNTWIASMVSTGRLRPVLLDSCPENVRELVVQCLSFDPAQRPSATDILDRIERMTLRGDKSIHH